MTQIVSLWTFACNIYSAPKVQAACLTLQKTYSVDVPLLLSGLWAGLYDANTPKDQQATVLSNIALAGHWREHCIQPLRHIRQTMKPLSSNSSFEIKGEGEGHQSWIDIRHQIKATELAAERALLEALEKNWLTRIKNATPSDIQSLSVDERTDVIIKLIHGHFPDLLSALYGEEHQQAQQQAQQQESLELLAVIIHAAYADMPYDGVLKSVVKSVAKHLLSVAFKTKS